MPYENDKSCTVAAKLQDGLERSLRRQVRGGVEAQQLSQIQELISSSFLANMEDRWVWTLNGNGLFRVSDIRILIDDFFLPKEEVATRWIKYFPIKINIFAWKRLPDRFDLLETWLTVEFRLVLWIVQFVLWFMKARLTSFLAALWQRILLALFVDGGIWDGRLLVLTSSGFLGSRMSNWVPFSKLCWKGSFMLRGGAFGSSEINCFSLLVSLGRMFFLMILLLALSCGVMLDTEAEIGDVLPDIRYKKQCLAALKKRRVVWDKDHAEDSPLPWVSNGFEAVVKSLLIRRCHEQQHHLLKEPKRL
ncbi:hypothetical protein Tco_1047764 [Tanacetum coccineum]